MKRLSTIFSLAAFVILLSGTPASGKDVSKIKDMDMERQNVEVVFVLDTTGSMGGLIAAAKEKIWSIANTLATAKPAPNIKMGLVGYRDRGDDYVTKIIDLTDDLDAVYKELMSFQASGGGDGPESVNQALHEAVTRLSWKQDNRTYQVVFLVGDAPPHMDYQNDVQYPETCEAAARAGIIINTIQCGGDSNCTSHWREISRKAEGRYFRVEQSGGAILAATPFDEKLAHLSRELDATYLYYGDAEFLKKREIALAETEEALGDASDAALARRATYKVSESAAMGFAGRQELLKDLEEGKVKLDDLDADKLPVDMKKMSSEERRAFVKENSEKRKKLEAEIKKLSEKRQAHLLEQMKKNDKGKGSLDFAIFECIKEQAGKKAIKYEGGPSL